MQKISATSIINAPKELVWEILLDFENYQEWNPFTRRVDCSLKVGEKVGLHVDMTNSGKTFLQKETLLWVKKGKAIAWGINLGFLLHTVRDQILTELEPNKTKYHTYDKFEGIFVPFILFFYRKKIQAGFDAVAAALKNRAEALYNT